MAYAHNHRCATAPRRYTIYKRAPLLGLCLAALLLAACGTAGGANTVTIANAAATPGEAVIATDATNGVVAAADGATATSAADTATALAATDATSLSRATATLAPTSTAAPTYTPTAAPTDAPTLAPSAPNPIATEVARQTAAAQSVAQPPLATATMPRPTIAKRLRFVKLNEDDDPGCVSVRIEGVATSGWVFQVNGSAIVGRFDGNGNARACGLAPRQEATLTIFNAQRAVVVGGENVPIRGSAIMRAAWQ